MKKFFVITLCSFASAAAFAALPPLTPEAQAAASLASAKAAYAGRVGNFELCQSQNKVADRFRVPGTPAPAACAVVPPFVAPVAAAPAAK